MIFNVSNRMPPVYPVTIKSMYVKAIESVAQFTRPIHIISRTYGGLIIPGSATLFFVNDEGVAITCKHVADLIVNAEQTNARFDAFKSERNRLVQDGKYKNNLARLEAKYSYKSDTTVQTKINFVNSVDLAGAGFTAIGHASLDLAIIRFDGFKQKFYHSHAIFVRDPGKVKQGKSLCRLGYPFPEFTNFRHNPNTDDIEWTQTGTADTPQFPMDGIITRFVSDSRQIHSIEMSTPGLRGQSGGPLFDSDGIIYGMQYVTNHLHMGFDILQHEILQEGKKIKISNYPFIHVGHCIHADKIREFLRLHDVKFYEEDQYQIP